MIALLLLAAAASEPASQPTSEPASLPAAQPASEPAEHESFETVVTGWRARRKSDEHKLTREQLQHVPGALGDPIRQLQAMPGVAMLPLLNGTLIVRGTRSGDTAFFIDGMPIPYVYHFGSGFGPSVFPTVLIESLVFTPSVPGPRYGGMLGGTVELKTRDRFEKLVHGHVSLDLLSAQAHLYVAPTEQLALEASVRRSYIEIFAGPLAPSMPDRIPAIIPYFTDYQAHAAARFAKAGHFDLWFYGSDDGFTLVGGNAFADQIRQLQTLLHKTSFNAWKPRWRIKSDRIDHELSALLTLTGVATDPLTQTWQVGLRDELTARIGDNLTLRLGLDSLSTMTSVAATVTTDLLANSGSDVHRVAVYADVDTSFWRFDLRGGLRFTAWSMGLVLTPRVVAGAAATVTPPPPTITQSLEPRATLGFRAHDRVRLSLASGLYVAPLPTNAWLPQLGPSLTAQRVRMFPALFDTVELGYDRSVLARLEQSWQSVASASWQALPWLTVEVNGFLNLMHDVTSTRVFGAPQTIELRQRADRRAYGVELFVRTPGIKGFSGYLSYTLSSTEDVQGRVATPADYSQTHVLALALSYAAPLGFNFGLRFRLGSGWPVTPIVASRFNVGEDQYHGEVGQRNSGRTPPVHQLDLRIEKTFRFQRWSLSTYAEVMNVYAQKNPEYDYLAWDFSSVRYISIIPILPMIGVSAEL